MGRLALAGALAVTLLMAAVLWFRSEAERARSDRDAAVAALESEQRVSSRLRSELDAERAAMDERAARLASQERETREFRNELAKCDLDPGFVVPGALYERLCKSPGG